MRCDWKGEGMDSFLNTELLLQYFTRLMVVFLVSPLHEFAHAWTAHKMGDDTAKDMGRMTINPMAHLDGWGALLIVVAGFGWAKPVPVKPTNFKHPRFGMMVTAVAGPAMNLLAALIGMIVFRLCGGADAQYIGTLIGYVNLSSSKDYLMLMLGEFISINLVLCIFNMIPIPPLDGSRVLTFLLPPKAALWVMRNQRYFYVGMIILMFTGILNVPLYFVRILLIRILLLMTGWIPAIF